MKQQETTLNDLETIRKKKKCFLKLHNIICFLAERASMTGFYVGFGTNLPFAVQKWAGPWQTDSVSSGEKDLQPVE